MENKDSQNKCFSEPDLNGMVLIGFVTFWAKWNNYIAKIVITLITDNEDLAIKEWMLKEMGPTEAQPWVLVEQALQEGLTICGEELWPFDWLVLDQPH